MFYLFIQTKVHLLMRPLHCAAFAKPPKGQVKLVLWKTAQRSFNADDAQA